MMWAYRLALSLGQPLRLHERVVIREETDPGVRRVVAERYFRQGRSLQIRGRSEEALVAWQRGSFVDPEYPALHGAVGAVFLTLGRQLEAVSWLERAAELEPRRAEWRFLLAQAFEATGRPGEALRLYRVALALDPAHGIAQDGVRRLEHQLKLQAQAADRRPWWVTGNIRP